MTMADPGARSGAELDGYRKQLMLTGFELWLDYFALGGVASLESVTSYLAGASALPVVEHNTLAQALNESFIDLGENKPVPYIE
jgi:hypothetical protein